MSDVRLSCDGEESFAFCIWDCSQSNFYLFLEPVFFTDYVLCGIRATPEACEPPLCLWESAYPVSLDGWRRAREEVAEGDEEYDGVDHP